MIICCSCYLILLYMVINVNIQNKIYMVNPLKQVYKTSYNNTHSVAFVYSQRQEIRSMTAIRTQQCAMASPGRSRVPGPESRVLVAPAFDNNSDFVPGVNFKNETAG